MRIGNRFLFIMLIYSSLLFTTLPAGAEQREMLQGQGVSKSTATEVADTLGGAVKAALNGDYEDFVDSLSTPDRERLARVDQESRDMESSAEQFENSWRGRFRDSIDWDSKDTLARVFGNTEIRKTDDRHVMVQIPASHNMPPVTLSLRNEGTVGDQWRIDTPDNLTGDQLKMRLQNELQGLNNSQPGWPGDRASAEQYAAHRVLSAIPKG